MRPLLLGLAATSLAVASAHAFPAPRPKDPQPPTNAQRILGRWEVIDDPNHPDRALEFLPGGYLIVRDPNQSPVAMTCAVGETELHTWQTVIRRGRARGRHEPYRIEELTAERMVIVHGHLEARELYRRVQLRVAP